MVKVDYEDIEPIILTTEVKEFSILLDRSNGFNQFLTQLSTI